GEIRLNIVLPKRLSQHQSARILSQNRYTLFGMRLEWPAPFRVGHEVTGLNHKAKLELASILKDLRCLLGCIIKRLLRGLVTKDRCLKFRIDSVGNFDP